MEQARPLIDLSSYTGAYSAPVLNNGADLRYPQRYNVYNVKFSFDLVAIGLLR